MSDGDKWSSKKSRETAEDIGRLAVFSARQLSANVLSNYYTTSKNGKVKD